MGTRECGDSGPTGNGHFLEGHGGGGGSQGLQDLEATPRDSQWDWEIKWPSSVGLGTTGPPHDTGSPQVSGQWRFLG